MTTFPAEAGTMIVRIPVAFKRRGGRKLVIIPEGAAPEVQAPPAGIDDTLVKTLVKAHRWRRRIETGKAKSITDLAEQEMVTVAYVQRVLALTCLAPDITAAITIFSQIMPSTLQPAPPPRAYTNKVDAPPAREKIRLS